MGIEVLNERIPTGEKSLADGDFVSANDPRIADHGACADADDSIAVGLKTSMLVDHGVRADTDATLRSGAKKVSDVLKADIGLKLNAFGVNKNGGQGSCPIEQQKSPSVLKEVSGAVF